MADIDIRIEGRAGRITLNRPAALNALSYQMILEIEAALNDWRDDDQVALVLVDAAGDKAFCAGGDIQEMYDTAMRGDYEYGRRFWADEYRVNAAIAEYPKPYVALMQGFVMGGGVGVSCHGSHRIVCETSQIAMPECGIGLVPDVGGSWLLAQAPGHLGEYLALTADRMGPGDAIYAGFADSYVEQSDWVALVSDLEMTGNVGLIRDYVEPPPPSPLAARQDEIDRWFASGDLATILRALNGAEGDFAERTLKAISRNSPLSMSVALANLKKLRVEGGIHQALQLEYRFTARAAEHGDFLEGIRAAIIDKDRKPKWRHPLDHVDGEDVARMLMPLPNETPI